MSDASLAKCSRLQDIRLDLHSTPVVVGDESSAEPEPEWQIISGGEDAVPNPKAVRIGVPFHAEYLAFGAAMETEGYRAINPLGKLPALVHNGRTITETAAICCYLADVFPEKRLAPPPNDRAEYYRWLFFTVAPLEATLTNHVLDVHVPEELRRSINYSLLDEPTDLLDERLSASPFIAGHAFKTADVLLGTQLGWHLQYDIIDKWAAFVEYVQRLAERPAYERAKARIETASEVERMG